MTIDETASLLSVETSSNNDGCRPLSNYGTIPHTEQDEDHIATSQRSLLAIVLPMALGIFLVAMDSTIVVASYASIGNELKQLSKVSWIATGYMLTLTSFQPLYGKLSDIFGLDLGTSFGWNWGWWNVHGGVINIVFASGSSVGAPLGGFLADTIGWRCDIGAIEKTDFRAKIKRVDFAGAASLVTCIFFLLFGLDNGGNVSWTDRATVGSLLASTVLFILFGAIEMEWAKEPFAPKRIVLNRSLIASYLVNFFSIASNLSMLFHVSLYLQAVEGLSPSRVGFWLVPGIIGGVTGSLGSGLIMKATGKYYWLTVLEYILLVGGSITIVLSAGVAIHSAIVISIGLVVSGLGNGGGITTSLISLISNAGQKDQAIATAVSYLFRSLGSVVGLSVGSTILQDVLRSILQQRLTGQDINEIVRRVRESLDYLNELDQSTRTIVLGGDIIELLTTY
ncbi:MFS general substrate transporter [Lentinula edodes]|uniref:MFS general substrate transporter n=1 Tax=Lentinula edodes TaxID=5353 RepID=A0A1Q3DXA6_LENED|nr:MFS general substrate transporter [Lentinula edodes]